MSVHIYTAPFQPFTRYFDMNMPGGGRWFQHRRREIGHCHSCRRRRWMKNLEIQVFYDCANVRCKDREGCTEAQTWAMSKRVKGRKR